jgi:hypothetical protein
VPTRVTTSTTTTTEESTQKKQSPQTQKQQQQQQVEQSISPLFIKDGFLHQMLRVPSDSGTFHIVDHKLGKPKLYYDKEEMKLVYNYITTQLLEGGLSVTELTPEARDKKTNGFTFHENMSSTAVTKIVDNIWFNMSSNNRKMNGKYKGIEICSFEHMFYYNFL